MTSAPRLCVPISDYKQFRQIEFANAMDGWLVVGPPQGTGVLYATHDDGVTWRQVPLASPVEVATSAGIVWVTTGAYGTHTAVYSAPVTSDSFTKRADTSGTQLSATGTTTYVWGDDSLSGRPAGGVKTLSIITPRTVTTRSLPCTLTFHITVAASASKLAAVCAGPGGAGNQDKFAYSSTPQGSSWTARQGTRGRLRRTPHRHTCWDLLADRIPDGCRHQPRLRQDLDRGFRGPRGSRLPLIARPTRPAGLLHRRAGEPVCDDARRWQDLDREALSLTRRGNVAHNLWRNCHLSSALMVFMGVMATRVTVVNLTRTWLARAAMKRRARARSSTTSAVTCAMK